MALNLKTAVSAKNFTGNSKVYSADTDGLAAIVRDALETEARLRFKGRNVCNFTNSSGGTAGMVFTATAATDIITFTAAANGVGDHFKTGDGPFRFTAATTLVDPLVATTDYYVRKVSAYVYTLHLTRRAAIDPMSTPVTLTDTGTGEQQMLAIGSTPEVVDDDGVGDTDSCTIASFDTSIDTVYTAYATLTARANELLAILGAGSLADGPGTAATATAGVITLAAIDVDVAASSDNTDGTTYASGKAAIDEIDASQKTLIAAINVCRKAVGLGRVPVARNLRGLQDLSLGINSGEDATDGVATTDAAGMANALTEANVELILIALRDNVALLTDLLDDCYDRDKQDFVSVGPVLQADTSGAFTNFVNSPVGGRIRNVHAQTTVAVTSADHITTLEIDGSAVSGASLTVATAGSAIGVHDVDGVLDTQVVSPNIPNVATGNYVSKGQSVELVGDGGGDAGGALFWLDIVPTGEDEPAMAAFAN